MKQIIILSDIGGYTERLDVLREAASQIEGYSVIGITPPDRPCEGFISVEIPESWLPLNDDFRGRGLTQPSRYWRTATYQPIAAIQQLGLDADFYWNIESDCLASIERWTRLFRDHKDNPDDLASTHIWTRKTQPNNPWWASCPGWIDEFHIGCLHRISARGAGWCADHAEELREVFCEFKTSSVIKRMGGVIGKINRTEMHYNLQTVRAIPSPAPINRNLINHPVKSKNRMEE